MTQKSSFRILLASVSLALGVFVIWIASFSGIYVVQRALGLLKDFNLGAAQIHVEQNQILLSRRSSLRASAKQYGVMPTKSAFSSGLYRAYKRNNAGVVVYFEIDPARQKNISLLLADPRLQLPPGCAIKNLQSAKTILLCKSSDIYIGYWPEKKVGVSVLPPSEETLISAFANVR